MGDPWRELLTSKGLTGAEMEEIKAGILAMAARPMVGQQLTARDPEPPTGTLVRDDCGITWRNDGHRPCCWVRPDLVEQGIHDPETWNKVAGNYGPVTVLEWGGGRG